MESERTMSSKRGKTIVVLCVLLFVTLFTGLGLSDRSASLIPKVSALPEPGVLSLSASSYDAYAKYQTVVYAETVTTAGSLSHIIMTLPTGSTATNPRSSSGTVAVYRPGQLIWRPASPINVVVGTRLSIPITGIDYTDPGTSNLWMIASNAAGDTLAYARADFSVQNNSPACQTTGNDYIQRENAKTGNPQSEWKIAATAFNASVFSAFANSDSYQCGDTVMIRVDSQATSLATVKAYRMGYYGGTGAREIWSSGYFLTGKQPAAAVVTTANPAVKNMVDANNWNYNLGIRLDGRFTPGTYLLKLSDRAGKETYVPFTVRDSATVKHDFLLQQATTTWQAYNGYGGHSFYSAIPGNASRLSFNRPYSDADGRGSGQFLQLESGLVYQMEKEGRDVAYWTDTDLHTKGSTELTSRTKTLILPAHDEYYSTQMRGAIDKAINQQGINLVSFGANQIHREILFTTSYRSYDVKNAYSMTSGADYKKTTFRNYGANSNEQVILGAQYGCGGHADVTPNNSWMWTGTSGTPIGGFINGEADYQNVTERAYKFGYLVPVPENNTKLIKDIPMQNCRVSGEANIADIVARTTGAGTRVFSGSSFAYSCFITKSCPSNWKEGPRTNPTTEPTPTFNALSISDTDSQNAAQVVSNVLDWISTGVAPGAL